VLACGAFVLCLAALDRLVAWTDLGYRAARYRPNEDRRLTRAEFDVRVVTNALGFRDARMPGPKPAGVRRVVVLGDSFTQGYGVDETASYPRRLEAGLARAGAGAGDVEIVNLGVPGTSPRDYIGHLADPGLAYAPDLVLIGVMGNDVQDVWIQRRFGVRFASELLRDVQRDIADGRPLWRRAPALLLPNLYPLVWTEVADLRRSLAPRTAVASAAAPPSNATEVDPARWRDVVLEMGERFGREPETTAALAAVPPARRDAIAGVATGTTSLDSEPGADGYLALLATIDPHMLADAVLLPPSYDAAWRETEGHLRGMIRMARRAGSRVAIVYIPAIHQVTDASRPALEGDGFVWDERTLTDTTFSDRLRRLGDAEGVAVVDLLPVFRAAHDPSLYYPHDGHWTAKGHALAADALVAPVARELAAR
jgi:lysophospholipase L1-like esterase